MREAAWDDPSGHINHQILFLFARMSCYMVRKIINLFIKIFICIIIVW